MNSIDEIIEIYKRDVDVTMIDEGLKRTVEERMQSLEAFEDLREEFRKAREELHKRMEQGDAVL